MAYHDREYEVYVLKGMGSCVDLWSWQNWEKWAAALSPFTNSVRGKSAVRCLQISADSKKTIPFGKLSWDEKSHQRWAHNSPINVEEWKRWQFLNLEAWTPSWNVCIKEKVPPDFYFNMRDPNGNSSAPKRPSPFLVCAIASSVGQNRINDLESTLVSLLETLPDSILAIKKRPWGISSFGQGSFTHAIQDMTESVLSGATEFDRMRKPFDEDLLPETWRRIERPHA